MKEITREEIKDFLGLKKWTIQCDRLKKIIDQNHIENLKRVHTHSTTDFHFATRKCRVGNWECIKYGVTKGIGNSHHIFVNY